MKKQEIQETLTELGFAPEKKEGCPSFPWVYVRESDGLKVCLDDLEKQFVNKSKESFITNLIERPPISREGIMFQSKTPIYNSIVGANYQPQIESDDRFNSNKVSFDSPLPFDDISVCSVIKNELALHLVKYCKKSFDSRIMTPVPTGIRYDRERDAIVPMTITEKHPEGGVTQTRNPEVIVEGLYTPDLYHPNDVRWGNLTITRDRRVTFHIRSPKYAVVKMYLAPFRK